MREFLLEVEYPTGTMSFAPSLEISLDFVESRLFVLKSQFQFYNLLCSKYWFTMVSIEFDHPGHKKWGF